MSQAEMDKKNGVDYIIQLLSQIYPVSEKLALEFHQHAIAIQLQKDEHILKQGEICKHMYFIKEGAMMAYSSHNHQQITTYISVENEFLSSLSGLYGEFPSRESIIAIEPTLLLGVHTDVLLGWYDRYFDLNFIIRKVYENYYRDAQERSHMVRVGNAKERYLYFLNSRGGDVNRLPIACVASFLNMKPETLIRIKKQLGNELQPKEIKKLAKELDLQITVKKLFIDRNLSLKKLAKELSISTAKISYVLNHHYQLVFKDFINQYRIAYFKDLLIDKNQLQHFTIATLALQAGFSSKSSFYKAFKKQEGINPSELIDWMEA